MQAGRYWVPAITTVGLVFVLFEPHIMDAHMPSTTNASKALKLDTTVPWHILLHQAHTIIYKVVMAATIIYRHHNYYTIIIIMGLQSTDERKNVCTLLPAIAIAIAILLPVIVTATTSTCHCRHGAPA